MKLIKNNYEEGYHDNLLYREMTNAPRNRTRLDLVRQHQPGGRLLEIGCGHGGFLRMAREWYDIEGIDISTTAIHKIQAEFGERVRVGNVEQDALPAQRYSVIAAFNILEHLRAPQAAVQRFHSALAEGGVLAGSVPNNSGLAGQISTRIGNYFDRTHVFTPPPAEWQRIFQDAGFRAIDLFGEITFGRNHCRYVRSTQWRQVSFNLMFVCRK